MSGPLAFWPHARSTGRSGKSPLKIPAIIAAAFKSRIRLPPCPGHSSKGREFPAGMIASDYFPEIPGEYQSRPGQTFPEALLHQAGLHPARQRELSGRPGCYPIFRVNYPVMMRRYGAGKHPLQRPARVHSLLNDSF